MQLESTPHHDEHGTRYCRTVLLDISERKEAEEAYTLLVEHSLQALQIVQDGRIVFVNAAATRMTGYSQEETLALSPDAWLLHIHPDDREVLIQRSRDRLAGTPVPSRYECRFIRKDGTVRWIEVLATSIMYGGRPAIHVASIDITERKEAEEAYRMLVDNSLQALVIFQDGCNVFANPAATHITGYTQDELLAMSPEEATQVVYPDDQMLLAERARKRQQGEDVPPRYEFRLIRKDGAVRWVECFNVRTRYRGKPAVQMTYVDITERKEAEEALRESRALLQGVLDHAPAFIFAKDVQGRLVLANRPLERLFQVGHGEMLGKTDYDFHAPEIAAHNWAVDLEVQRTRQMVECEEYSTNGDGTLHTYLSIKFPLFDDDGNLTGTCGIATDITERKRMEEALRASEQRLARAEQIAHLGSWEMDVASGKSIWSDEFFRICGFEPGAFEPTMEHGLQIIHPDDQTTAMTHVQQAIDQRATYEIEKRIVRPDGTIRWVHSIGAVICDAQQQPVTLSGAFLDITERKQTEEAVQRQWQFLRQVIDSTPAFIFARDHDGRFTLVNQTLADVYGTTVEALLGKTDADMHLDAQELERIRREDRQVIDTGTELVIPERHIKDAHGRNRYFSVVKRLLIMPDDTADQVLVVGADITERKQAEEALRQSEQRFHHVLRSSPVIIFTSQASGEYGATFVSDNVRRVLGYEPGEFIAQSDFWASHIHPDDAPTIFANLPQLFEHNEHEHVYRFLHRDGTYRWMYNVMRLIRDAYGVPVEIIGTLEDITERKEAEEALQFQAKLLNSIGQSVIATTLDGTITYWNRAAEYLYGWTKHEVMGQNVLNLTLAQPVYAQPGEIIARIRQGESWEGEFLARHRDGTTFPAWVTDVPFFNEQGQVSGVIGISMDITERKQAEQALRASEARFRTLIDHLPDSAVFLVDHDLRFLAVRGQGVIKMGWNPDLLEGKPLQECLPPDTYASVIPIYQAALAGTAPAELEQTWRDRTYHLRPLSLRNEHGIIVAAMILAQDITERKEAEEALRQSEQRLQAIFDNAAVGIGLTDKTGQSILANARGAQQLGYTPEELAQYSNLELTHPDDRAETVERMQQLVRGEIQGYRIEKRYFRKDGSIFWADLSVSAVYDDDGQIAYLLGIVVDISERKQLEHQLHQANMLLQEQAICDPLTGLHNRRYLDETLPRELQRAERARQPVGVIMLDIDHFKWFNDTYGHDAGDTVLRAVGAFLQHNTRGADIACRYGGEEFTLVLPGASLADTQQRAEELREGVQTLVVKHGGQALPQVTASLGVAIFPEQSVLADDIIRLADQALYQAKRNGRNRVEVGTSRHSKA